MKISILGCGWLGFPLAQQLLRNGYDVKGSTRTQKKCKLLKANGVSPYKLSLPDDYPGCSDSSFWMSDTLFFNIPPDRKADDVVSLYSEKVNAVRESVENSGSQIKTIIFASSTSVYPRESGYYKEDDAGQEDSIRTSGKAVLRAEQILLESTQFETIVLRFGGLYGYDRHPVKHLSGRTGIPSPCQPVNLIHQDDCIRIIRHLLKSDIKKGIYNAVSDGHPPRNTLYQSAARHFEIAPPKFDLQSESIDRVISNEKLKKDLDYSFIYPNPMDHAA